MAEYEPFPNGNDGAGDDRSLKRGILGCFGCGGLGVAGFFGVVVLLVGGLGAGATSCDIEGVGDPGKGTASQRLDVDVAPSTDLAGGTVVRITSDAFDPDDVVGVAVCLRSADTQAKGVDACDEDQGARYATDGTGHLDATYAVPRVITVGNRAYDCAADAGRCLVVAADASDYDESGGKPITFRTGLPAAELTPNGARPATDHLPIGARPAPGPGPVAPGTELTVLASGFQPGEPLLIAYCTSALETTGVVASCDPVDATSAVQAIMMRSVDGDFPRADDGGAFTTTLEARPTVAPYGDDLAKAAGDYGADPTTTSTTSGAPSTTRPGGATTTTRLPDGEVACTAAAGGCSIVIAAAADTKRSAVLPYTVSG
jgi:hypothetical protein